MYNILGILFKEYAEINTEMTNVGEEETRLKNNFAEFFCENIDMQTILICMQDMKMFLI